MAKKKVTTPRKTSPAPFAPPQWPATRVELWKLDKIKPYPSNPRTHPQAQVDQLARDMISDGVTMPILVDEAGVIIAGHGRRLGALAAGFEEYPVAIARGWTEEQKQAARIKDNAVGLLSGWDVELVRGEIQNLSLAGYDIKMLGFTDVSLQEFGLLDLPAGGASVANASLAEQFGIPPFSVFNAREGWWQARKQAWIALGIQSELGRGEGAEPGGSKQPTINPATGKICRADSKGRPIPGTDAGKPGELA